MPLLGSTWPGDQKRCLPCVASAGLAMDQLRSPRRHLRPPARPRGADRVRCPGGAARGPHPQGVCPATQRASRTGVLRDLVRDHAAPPPLNSAPRATAPRNHRVRSTRTNRAPADDRAVGIRRGFTAAPTYFARHITGELRLAWFCPSCPALAAAPTRYEGSDSGCCHRCQTTPQIADGGRQQRRAPRRAASRNSVSTIAGKLW